MFGIYVTYSTCAWAVVQYPFTYSRTHIYVDTDFHGHYEAVCKFSRRKLPEKSSYVSILLDNADKCVPQWATLDRQLGV